MKKLQTPGQFAVALGLAYLATTILFLGFEASAIRKQMPLVLTAIEGVGEGGEAHPMLVRLDTALAELSRASEEIKALREQIPDVLAESAAIRALVPLVLAEVKEVREAVGPVLAESTALRTELPGIIEDVGQVVDDAKGVSKNVGKGAAQGAVEGTVKGIIGAPFEVLKQGADLIVPGSSEKKPEDSPQEE